MVRIPAGAFGYIRGGLHHQTELKVHLRGLLGKKPSKDLYLHAGFGGGKPGGILVQLFSQPCVHIFSH